MRLRYFVAPMLLTVLCAVSAVNCGEDSVDDRYFRIHAGEARAELIKRLGPPTSERAVAANDEAKSCSGTTDRSEMDYDLPRDGLATTLRGWFHLTPALTIVVCLDGNAIVTHTNMIEY